MSKKEGSKDQRWSVDSAEDRYKAVFENSLDGVILGRSGGGLIEANPAACELLGYSRQELVGQLSTFVFDFDDERTRHAFVQRHERGEYRGRLQLIHKEGYTIPTEVAVRSFISPQGEDLAVVVVRDLRPRLELEESLRQAQKLEVLGRLSGGIAHDFNNLLAVIRSAADILQDQVMEEGIADLELLQEATTRAAALTKRLLAISRRQPVQLTLIEPRGLITQLEGVLRSLVGEKHSLRVELEENLCPIYADPSGIEQSLLNLIVNAREAMPEGGEITLRAGHRVLSEMLTDSRGQVLFSGGYLSIEIEDKGVGIEETTLEQIFQPFFTTKKEGTGLGLSIVAQVVEAADGGVVFSKKGKGGVHVELLFPDSTPTGLVDVEHLFVKRDRDVMEKIRILLVEDQLMVRKATSRLLQATGYEVETASNGAEAMTKIAEEAGSFDLVITDVVMPEMTGFEVVAALRERDPALKFLMVSGFVGDAEEAAVNTLGVELVMKPFSLEEIELAIHRALARE